MNTDPITLEVLRNALQSAAEEMGATLTRTALSPNIKDRRDCSTAIYTIEGSLVAQAEHIPLHLGLMPTVVKEVLKFFPVESLAPGDAVIINDPYISGSHLPDVCVISPVFAGNAPLAVVANLAHHVDMGGAVPGSMSTTATEIFQEGLRIPPVKICRGGRVNQDLLKVLAHNVRTAGEFYGDIQAQLSANQVGVKRLQELAMRVGVETLQYYMGEIINYAERRIRAAIKELPAGVYAYTDYLEGDGITRDPVKITAAVHTGEELVKVDFTGTSPQVKGPVNATRGVTLACVYYALKAVADPDLPASEGIARVLEVITPPGSLVNPRFPAPVAHANINTAQRITDVVLGALAQAVPHRVTAAGTGSMSNFTIGGKDGRRQRYYSYVETYGGGQGAKYNQDGMDGVHVNMTNTLNTPVEVIEMNYPLLVERYGLIPDSGGPGEFRGGTGLVREITVLEDATVAVSTERNVQSPWGLRGGRPGRTSRCLIRLPGDNACEMPGKFTREVPRGTTITLETAGGGGYGNPFDRSPEAVRQDVISGLVSKTAAFEDYGVMLDEALQVDQKATANKRDKGGRHQS
ncbi:hydantoinase B/oxoprolinase family protein [Desulfallas sp. Bu1-1]|uniref:hydantoinase B/oxoprolinase family protein n=1 Tax=Desulfallas sp. Bu1-1 TaxID=2787620 RepID=UPI00189DA1C9|nr:hydantoinase B/oxoprolinase family protein [Desulfallas sp. Bu1-1]MBF7083866.1 hydantoinase B/oxoprolinase family protein [Desulfallas sp. Bu1-1]